MGGARGRKGKVQHDAILFQLQKISNDHLPMKPQLSAREYMIETYVSSNDGFIESPGHFPSASLQSPRSDVGTGRCFLLIPGRGESLEEARRPGNTSSVFTRFISLRTKQR